MTKHTYPTNGKEIEKSHQRQEIQVKLGRLKCTKDKFGNKTWSIEQVPVIKE